MFWSGNYTLGKGLTFLLKEENVTLTQVLESSEILTECKANNTALIQYLTRPDILSELITMITEEPPKKVDKQLQYRYSNIACEVLTSHVATLKDKLSSDAALMNRLCNFLEQEPPLNPLLASYFSRMVETLLAKSFKEDWCLYNIVCLRVLDQFRAHRGFLPALLRHLPTSAAADTILVLLRQEDALHDVIMQWLEEHQFVETLVRIMCGIHEDMLDNDTRNNDADNNTVGDEEGISTKHATRARLAASDNVVRLLCELLEEPLGDNNTQIRASVLALLQTPSTLDILLQGMFSAAPEHMKLRALVNGGKLLQALLYTTNNAAVERALAPHLPLLHQALLRSHSLHLPDGVVRPVLGGHRLQLARLVAALVASKEDMVATALVALGTVGTLLELWWEFPDNSFLQSAAVVAIMKAVENKAHLELYWTHLFYECDIAMKILDAFENEQRKNKLGHMWSLLDFFTSTRLPKPALERYDSLLPSLRPTMDRLGSPLGGYYPSQKSFEEGELSGTARYFNSAELQEFQEIIKKLPQIERENEQEDAEDDDEESDDKQYYTRVVDDVLRVSPWLNEDAIKETEAKGWARWRDTFSSEQDVQDLTEVSPTQQLQEEFTTDLDNFKSFWSYNATDGEAAEQATERSYTELANNLLTVMKGMTTDFVTDLVHNESPEDQQYSTAIHNQKTEEQHQLTEEKQQQSIGEGQESIQEKSTGEHELSMWKHHQFIEEQQQSTGEQQQSTGEQQQSTEEQQQSTREKQQLLGEQQQPVGEKQLFTEEKRSTGEQQSLGEEKQSIGEKQQSIGEKQLYTEEKRSTGEQQQSTETRQLFLEKKQLTGEHQQLTGEPRESTEESQRQPSVGGR